MSLFLGFLSIFLKMELPYDPEIPLLGVYLEKKKKTWYKSIHASQHSLQLCLQQPRQGNNLDVPQQGDR